jgi:hypothetical protein
MKKQFHAFVETDMDDKERATLKEQIVWLGIRLEEQRHTNRNMTAFLKSLVHPDEFGHAVSQEVRQMAYALLINNQLEN